MTPVMMVECALLIPHAILAGVVLIACRKKPMPDFTALNSATANLTATTGRVQTAFAALDDASVQASIDSATAAVTAADQTLTTLAPVPVQAPAPDAAPQ